MQNYMISSRKKNGVSPSETVEDRAAKDFRSLVRTREEQLHQKRTNRLMYAVSACLVLIVIIMGVTTINNFDKMKSVQTALNKISSSSSGDTQSVEAKETSGSVTAVTGEAAGKQIGQDNIGQADGDEDGQALDNTAGGAGDEGADIKDNDSTDSKDSGKEDADTLNSDAGANGSDGVYVVEQGDTLAIISRKMYGDVNHVESICKMNGLTNGNLIYVGQKLVLP